MQGQHHYSLTVTWTGNRGTGTNDYRAYDRSHTVKSTGKSEIECSSDPAFRGDKTKYNPEEMLVASISSCHMLWYLHLCADAGIIVSEYVDRANGIMEETTGGGGHFVEVILNPLITLNDPKLIDKAKELHERANQLCFIANSCNFPIHHKPEFQIANA